MIAVDTNVIVRLLTRDDESQYQKALQVMRDAPRIFLPDTVILETEWVLRHAYGFAREDIHSGLKALFGLENLMLRDAKAMHAVLAWYKDGCDFADALHLAQCPHCRELFTFDKSFASRAGMISRCPVTLL